METRKTNRQTASVTTTVANKENTAMNRKLAITAAIAGFAVLIAVTGARQTQADVQGDPVSRTKVFERSVAAQVLRNYPMPGDPHDAIASFNELLGQ